MKPPTKLYKYCPFNVWALRAINEAEVFHASPEQFNDPLDCHPSIQLDIDTDDLILLFRAMTDGSMLSPQGVDHRIANMRYNATEYIHSDDTDRPPTQEEIDRQLRWQLETEIQRCLQVEMAEKGVLALSETYASALMWSHYADHHRGLCLEYDTSKFSVPNLGSVDYRAPRALRAHDLYLWKVRQNDEARIRIFKTYFYAKSDEWSYEREWRDINDKVGVHPLHFQLTGVHFGMRIDQTVRQTIIKILSKDRDVQLYDVWAEKDTFNLKRSEAERDYFEQSGIRQPPFIIFGQFADISTERSEAIEK
jgi:Protein of unknown function (DUF2971)